MKGIMLEIPFHRGVNIIPILKFFANLKSG